MIKLYFEETDNAKAHSEMICRRILGKYLNTDGDNLIIHKAEFGKPYLRDYPKVHYNISHTNGVLVCAIADEPVGVDIENIKSFNRLIVERFFTKSEQDYILNNEEDQDERFALIWTKKEAYVKWIGKGLSIPFESFDVLNNNGVPYIYSFLHDKNCISICIKESKLINRCDLLTC